MASVTISPAESPEAFAARHFDSLDLGDRRLNRRAVLVAESIAAAPAASIPKQAADTHQAKAAYRFFSHHAVTSDTISSQHRDLTLEAARTQPVVLFVQDSSHLSFAPPEGRAGLGPVGSTHASYGLMMHATLALTPGERGTALGLADLRLWARDPKPRKESQIQRRARGDRESLRWSDVVETVGTPPPGSRFVHVADREADVWETFAAVTQVGADCVIRACGAAARRKASHGHADGLNRADADELRPLVRGLAVAGHCTVHRAGGAGRKARSIELSVSHAAVTLHPPKMKAGSSQEPPIRLWAVRVWEADPPAKETPIEWVLLTAMPVRSVAEALCVADWYRHRWTIEEYFKCLKTGCKVQERQLQEGERLEPLIAMLSITALRLLNVKRIAKLTPGAPATDAVPREYVEVLSKLRGIPMKELTCDRFWRETAILGGFMGRRGDGDPGWQTLWSGWHDLNLIVMGARLFGGQSYG